MLLLLHASRACLSVDPSIDRPNRPTKPNPRRAQKYPPYHRAPAPAQRTPQEYTPRICLRADPPLSVGGVRDRAQKRPHVGGSELVPNVPNPTAALMPFPSPAAAAAAKGAARPKKRVRGGVCMVGPPRVNNRMGRSDLALIVP